MLSEQAEIFYAAAREGSFTRASRVLYISSTAIMKQINALEARLNLTLFERSSRGVQLTEAGKILYEEVEYLKKHSDKAISRARALANHKDSLRVGTSILNPAGLFMQLYNQIYPQSADCTLELIPFQDDQAGILDEIDALGDKYDFLVGVCDSKLWLEHLQMLELGRWKKMIAMPKNHPLARKDILSIEDLHGYTLMMVKAGDSATNDAIRQDLQENHPQIHIEDTSHFYDMSVFNLALQQGNLLLNLECWKDVHPGLVTKPVDWDYAIPYGLLYSREPSPAVQDFVQKVKAEIEKGSLQLPSGEDS